MSYFRLSIWCSLFPVVLFCACRLSSLFLFHLSSFPSFLASYTLASLSLFFCLFVCLFLRSSLSPHFILPSLFFLFYSTLSFVYSLLLSLHSHLSVYLLSSPLPLSFSPFSSLSPFPLFLLPSFTSHFCLPLFCLAHLPVLLHPHPFSLQPSFPLPFTSTLSPSHLPLSLFHLPLLFSPHFCLTSFPPPLCLPLFSPPTCLPSFPLTLASPLSPPPLSSPPSCLPLFSPSPYFPLIFASPLFPSTPGTQRKVSRAKRGRLSHGRRATCASTSDYLP